GYRAKSIMASSQTSSSSSAATAPAWTNTSAPNRPTPIEDHRGTSSSSSTGMDELLAPVSTLDEPVGETIMRDVRAVGAKLKAVLIPLDRNVSDDAMSLNRSTVQLGFVLFLLFSHNLFIFHCRKKPFGYVGVLQEEDVEPSDGQRNVLNQLRDWDLWGPLFVCLSLALILSTKAPAKQTSHVFTTVFIVMWVGSLVVTINAQLLGANISIFQSLCVSIGILCLSIDSVSVSYCNIKIYMAGDSLVGFNLVGVRVPLGDKGVIYFCGSIREERKEIACFISSIFLLFAFGVAYFIVLIQLCILHRYVGQVNNLTATRLVQFSASAGFSYLPFGTNILSSGNTHYGHCSDKLIDGR
ncbi:hypothetical protein ACHAXR_004075, partial [Thalassiosira sp. AJA248-18]